jgi:hypothetical protein
MAGNGYLAMTNRTSVGVHYSLVVLQLVDDDVKTGQLAGQLQIHGVIVLLRGHSRLGLSNQNVTLTLADGRRLEAKVKKGDPMVRQWEIVGVGDKGLAPC